MPNNPITFDPNSLYILLSDLGAERQFHWEFYHAITETDGQQYHLVNNADTGHTWKYLSRCTRGIPRTLTLLAAMKIAVIDPALHGPLGARLEDVSTAPPVTCRVWLKRALRDLDEEGFFQLTGKVEDIELEFAMAAVENRARNIRTVGVSSFSIV